MDTGVYMANQMDDQITASQIQYEMFCENLEKEMNDFIKESGFVFTADYVFRKYQERYLKKLYVRKNCKAVILKFEDSLKKVYGV